MNAVVYGLGTLGRDALAILVSMYLMFYLTEVRGIGGAQLAALTAIMVAMRVFDALNDPFMGVVVDNTRSRWGKFKPWIAVGALAWAGGTRQFLGGFAVALTAAVASVLIARRAGREALEDWRA